MSNRFSGASEAQAVDFSALGAAMSGLRSGGFAEGGPVHFSPAPEPRHFRPANPGQNPTAGWDPFDPTGTATASPAEPIDPTAQARAEGFAEGMAAAERMAAARGEADAQALGRIAAALEARAGIDRDAMGEQLRQTVLHLVTRLVGEIGVSEDILRSRISAATALLADSVDAAVLKLNPEDIGLVDGHAPPGLALIADPTIERGGFRIETRVTSIEDGPSAWAKQLAAALDRVAVPGAGI